MRIFEAFFLTFIITIESLATGLKPKKTSYSRRNNDLINGREVLDDKLLIAINDLSLKSETTDDQIILYDAPVTIDENIKSHGNKQLLLIIVPQSNVNINNENLRSTNQSAIRKNNRKNRTPEPITNSNHQQYTDSSSEPMYQGSVEEPHRNYLPELQPYSKSDASSMTKPMITSQGMVIPPQIVVPPPEPQIIAGDTYISRELQEPVEIAISGSILKPNKYPQHYPMSQRITFPRSGLVRIPEPVSPRYYTK